MNRTRFRPSLRLLIALAVWLAVVATTLVCARFAERLTAAGVQNAIWSQQEFFGRQAVDAWSEASPKTPAGLMAVLDPAADLNGNPYTADQLDPVWIWEVPANLTQLSYLDLGKPVWSRGPEPERCALVETYQDGTLGDSANPYAAPGCVEPTGDHAVAAATIPTGKGTVLVFIRTIDVSQERFPLQYQRAETRRLAILLGLVGALAAWLLAGAISRPLQRLQTTVTRFGDGDLDARADALGPSEVVSLAGGFNRMAEHVQRTVDVQRRFVADTSHELRTPAAAMLSATQALDLDAPHDEALDLLVPQAERLATLTDDLLVLNRFDEGCQRLDARPVDLLGAVHEAVAQVAAGRDVRIKGSVDGDVTVDPGRVMVIVRNLVANALQHGAEPVVVAVADMGQAVTIRVSDGGPGVPEGLRQSVFDRFVRGDDSRHGGGRGLGLSLARENARLHGGDLVLADGGHAFVLTLPVIVAAGTPVGEDTSSVRRFAALGPLVLRALPLGLCEGVAFLLGLLEGSGELYLGNDSHFFHRPTWQWLPVLLGGWVLAALLPVALERGVRRVVRGRAGRLVGGVLALALLVGAAVGTLYVQLGERPISTALALGGVLWVLWRAVRQRARRGRR